MTANSENPIGIPNKLEKCPKCDSRLLRSNEYPEGDCMICGWRKTRVPTKDEMRELNKNNRSHYKPHIPTYLYD